MSIQDTDRAAAEVAVAPRVALRDIEENIAVTYYTHGRRIASSSEVTVQGHKAVDTLALEAFVVCMIVLKNGWVVVGTSAPLSPANHNAELGRKLAYENAVRQIWPLMGFALKDKFHG